MTEPIDIAAGRDQNAGANRPRRADRDDPVWLRDQRAADDRDRPASALDESRCRERQRAGADRLDDRLTVNRCPRQDRKDTGADRARDAACDNARRLRSRIAGAGDDLDTLDAADGRERRLQVDGRKRFRNALTGYRGLSAASVAVDVHWRCRMPRPATAKGQRSGDRPADGLCGDDRLACSQRSSRRPANLAGRVERAG